MDLSANQLLDAVTEVLNERLGSQADADALMREIRQKSAQIVMPAMTIDLRKFYRIYSLE